jgi:hypothetical protein
LDAFVSPAASVNPCPSSHTVHTELEHEAVMAPDLETWIPVTDASQVVRLWSTAQVPTSASARVSDELEGRLKLIPVASALVTRIAFGAEAEALIVTVKEADFVSSARLVAVMVTGLLPPGMAAGA